MALDEKSRHLTSEQIQELLDQQLPPGEAALAREHLSVCARCQSEASGWSLLFSDLGKLPELEPRQGFLQEVIRDAPVRRPIAARARSWLGTWEAGRSSEVHIPPSSIQDYLEDLLPAQPAARLERHLASCTSCTKEVQEWKSIMEAVQPLGHFAPRPGFAERVMAQVMVPAPVPVRSGGWMSVPGRILAWTRSLLPESRHGWAVVGGIASAPTITMAALGYMVFSRPLLTPGAFGSYLLWKASELVGSVSTILSGWMMQNAVVSRGYAFLEPLMQSPLLLGAGGLVLSLISAGALWVLYRNLIATRSDGHYARARV